LNSTVETTIPNFISFVQVQGVTDCDNDHERSLTRHEALGFDRSGNKYWFICRRLFVEAQDGTILYYSTAKQLEELLLALDPDLFEAELCEAIEDIRPELERQMSITEKLTNEKKASFRKSYLELENGELSAYL
jgi:nucleosome-remodeling factor subunit BPTF